jgi:hypothetical protein
MDSREHAKLTNVIAAPGESDADVRDSKECRDILDSAVAACSESLSCTDCQTSCE